MSSTMFKIFGNYLCTVTPTSPPKMFVRYKRNIAKKLYKKRTTLNPGVQRQSQILNDNCKEPQDIEADDLESLESDFMNMGGMYQQHLQQVTAIKEREKFMIVKQKYFKEKFPNFLTWNDKKQIQYLHKSNADEWTIEKLSDGFPALPETIKKLIKVTWTIKNASRILNHDNSVKRNWELFKNGKLNIPPDLTDHLRKFTNRNYNGSNQTTVKAIEPMKNTRPERNGEFFNIIKSYKRTTYEEDSNKTPNSEFDISWKPQSETYVASENPKQHKHTTLASLKANLKENVSLGKQLEEDDKILLNSLTNTSMVNTVDIMENEKSQNSVIDLKDSSKTTYLSVNTSSKKDDRHLMYPEKIIIPKDKFKRKCTYKLNDCYYDSDGLFLYRVPGMD